MLGETRAVKIRQATSAEQETAFALAEEYFTIVGVVAREDRSHFIEEYFGPGRGFWLAEVNGELAGCVALRTLPLADGNGGEGSGCAEIKRMYVREEFRGKGIARQLLEAAEQLARDAGYAWIYLDTTDEMRTAARLYERDGFMHCERYNENPQAGIFMRKAISG